MPKDKKIKLEKETLNKMINIYCKDKHKLKEGLCGECEELLNYAIKRLQGCKFGEDKPVCGKCKIHCYEPEMRIKIIRVMRAVGPKMLLMHPVLTINHFIQMIKKKRV